MTTNESAKMMSIAKIIKLTVPMSSNVLLLSYPSSSKFSLNGGVSINSKGMMLISNICSVSMMSKVTTDKKDCIKSWQLSGKINENNGRYTIKESVFRMTQRSSKGTCMQAARPRFIKVKTCRLA